MAHYYDKNDNLDSDEKVVELTIGNILTKYTTDIGVFSKERVDFATVSLLETLVDEVNASEFKKVLDVGCGYGPIGITLAKYNAESLIHMVDVNDRSLRLAKGNIAMNCVENANVFESDVYSNVLEEDYTHVISNPPIRAGKKVVFEVLEGAFGRLKECGELWVVIHKKHGAESTKNKILEVFGNVEQVANIKGYRVFKGIKKES